MTDSNEPLAHPDEWVELTRGYITAVVRELVANGVHVSESWLDPRDPRDATLMLSVDTGRRALVWDEENGWRHGGFVAGRQGERTVLDDVAHLGGGVLPEPAAVASRFLAGHAEEARQYRSHADLCDGFDTELRSYHTRIFEAASAR